MSLPSKDEYLKASRGLATGFGATVDFADPQVGSTTQAAGGVPDSNANLPGQVFSVDQLPDPAIAVAYGLPPVTIPEHLILESKEEAEKDIQGKDVLDIANAQLRRDLGDPVLTFDNKIASAEDSLKSLSERTGSNAGIVKAALEAEDKKDDGQQTENGRPIDPEGVQKPDAGGTQAVPAADDGVEDSKATAQGGATGKTVQSGKKQS